MTEFQLNILRRCGQGVDIQLLPPDEQQILLWLAQQKLCQPEGGKLGSTVFVLLPAGEALLDSIDQHDYEIQNNEAKEQEFEKRNRRFQSLDSMNNVVVSGIEKWILECLEKLVKAILMFFH